MENFNICENNRKNGHLYIHHIGSTYLFMAISLVSHPTFLMDYFLNLILTEAFAFFIDFRDRGKGEGERGRNINVREKHRSAASQICPDHVRACNLLVYGMTLQPTEPPARTSWMIVKHSPDILSFIHKHFSIHF